ncbi:MAG: leucine-rich repeat domain-containing protein [Oscillospiraceae bacterium]|nr:leucine-rich repeat domain-containing protein [Oscillospiraceae bacterium]
MTYGNYLIPDGTQRIVRHQFKNLELEDIVLPEGLEWIGAHCFRLSKLRRLILPSTVKRIDFGAFSACDLLEEVVLPEGICEIGKYAFSECENLNRLIVPEAARIGEGAFYEYRLRNGCCPWCGTPLDHQRNCRNSENHARSWTGSLRLYHGLFWWNGEKLITVKVHCDQNGNPGYSVPCFGKRSALRSHREEWELLKKTGDPDIKGIPHYNYYPRGRVEIANYVARIFLHPVLSTPSIRQDILREFGLSQEIQGLKEIRFITDHSNHYHTEVESR